MQLDLKKFIPEAVLESYRFILKQYVGGVLAGMQGCTNYPTTYIFKEICIEIRVQYIQNCGTEQEIQLVEKKAIDQLVALSGKPVKEIIDHVQEFIANECNKKLQIKN